MQNEQRPQLKPSLWSAYITLVPGANNTLFDLTFQKFLGPAGLQKRHGDHLIYRLKREQHSRHGRRRIHEQASKNCYEGIKYYYILSLLLLYLKYTIGSTCLTFHRHDGTDPQRFQIQIYEVLKCKSCLFFDLSDLWGAFIINSRLFILLIGGVITATVLLHTLNDYFCSSNHMMLNLRYSQPRDLNWKREMGDEH